MSRFFYSNRVFDSVSDAESNGIKILKRLLGNPILENLIYLVNLPSNITGKFVIDSGNTNMRERFLVEVRLIAFYNLPVILVQVLK